VLRLGFRCRSIDSLPGISDEKAWLQFKLDSACGWLFQPPTCKHQLHISIPQRPGPVFCRLTIQLFVHSPRSIVYKSSNMSRASSRASAGPRDSRSSTNKASGATSPLKRLTHEISDLRSNPNEAVLHLGPSSDEDLFHWEAVLKGPRDQTSPYCGGLWLLSIEIPSN